MLKESIINSLIFLVLINCTSEKEKIAERNAIVDSTIINFEKIYFENQIDSVFTKNHFNGSIVVYKDSSLIFEKEKGFQDFKTKEKLHQNSVFAIGSLSKQFTAVLVLLQEEQGKLKVTDKVSQYLPEFQKPELQNITIHQLLNHTSGLNDFGEKLLFKSGTDFSYSNKGYRFLGELVAEVSGKSFDENAKELFEKLGMKNSSTANLFIGEDFAGAYNGNSTVQEKVEEMPKRLAEDDISISAGGILSTINDLQIWNAALFGGKILNSNSLQKLLKKTAERDHPIFGKVGYCYGIMTNLSAPKSYFHTGYVKGSPSLNIYYPETKTSVVILSNIADDSKGFDVIFKPHIEVKKTIDNIEIAVEELQKEMMKPLPNK